MLLCVKTKSHLVSNHNFSSISTPIGLAGHLSSNNLHRHVIFVCITQQCFILALWGETNSPTSRKNSVAFTVS